ncbi:MAG: hypothetical protein ACK6CT_01010 [Planctomycetia bacterium]
MIARNMAMLAGAFLTMGIAVAGEAPSTRPSAVPDTVSRPQRTAAHRQRDAERIPAARMSADVRDTVSRAVRSATIHRSLPAAAVSADAEFLDFAVSRPEVMVDLWRSLGISKLSLDPVAPGRWRLADGYGTTGTVELLHRERTATGGMCVFMARGGYTGSLSPRDLTGSCLVVVRYDAIGPDQEGRERQGVEIDAFLDVDGLGLEIVTRTLQPLIMRSAAANVREICLFVSHLTAAAARNPAALARLTDRMQQTAPQDRQAFAALAAGRRPPTATGVADDIREELAGRWLTVDQLDATMRR